MLFESTSVTFLFHPLSQPSPTYDTLHTHQQPNASTSGISKTNAIDTTTITSTSFPPTASNGSQAHNMADSNGYEWVPAGGLRPDMANSSFNRRRNDVNAEQPYQAIGGADRPPFHDRQHAPSIPLLDGGPQLPPPLFHPPLPTCANGGIPTTPPSNATRFDYPRAYIRPREEVGGRYHTGPHNPCAVGNQVQRSGLEIRQQELDEWSDALHHREQAVAAREAQMAWLERQRDSSSQSSRVGRVGQLIDGAHTTPTPQGSKRKRATSNEIRDDYDRVDFGAAPPARPILRPRSIQQVRSGTPLMRNRVPCSTPAPAQREEVDRNDSSDDESGDSSEDEVPIRPTKKIRRTGPSSQIGMNAEGRTMVGPLYGMDARGRTVFHEPPPQYRRGRIPYPYPAPHVAAPPPRAAYPNALTAGRGFQDSAQWQLHRVVTAYENGMSNRRLQAITARRTDSNGRTDEEKFQEMLAEYERRNRERGSDLQNASRNLQVAMDREVIYISSDSEDRG